MRRRQKLTENVCSHCQTGYKNVELPKRKPTRLKDYDYSTPGAYFITICTKDRKEMLSKIIVGDDALIVPENHISNYGLICDKYIKNINIKYENVIVNKYVINAKSYSFNYIS